jgi:hypothetical protein
MKRTNFIALDVHSTFCEGGYRRCLSCTSIHNAALRQKRSGLKLPESHKEFLLSPPIAQ